MSPAVSFLPLLGIVGMACLPWNGAQAQEVLPPEMGVSVSASKTARSKFLQEVEDNGGGAFPIIDYSAVVRDGVLRITPKLMCNDFDGEREGTFDYLESMESGAAIKPVSFGLEYCVSFPALDVKMTNNTGKTQYFTEAVLEVKSSSVDRSPLPLIFSNYDQLMYIQLINDGWGAMESLEVAYQLTKDRPRSIPASLPFQASFSNVRDELNLEMGKALEASGVDAGYIALCNQYRTVGKQIRDRESQFGEDYEKADRDPDVLRLRAKQEELYEETGLRAAAALKPFANNGNRAKNEFEEEAPYACWASGTLRYTWKDGLNQTQTKSLPFATEILLAPPDGLGAPGAVNAEYQTMLRPSGTDYTLTVAISHALRKGDVGRFLLTMGVPATSRHEMVLRLRTTDGKVTQAVPLNVHGLLPRTAAEMLSGMAPQQ